MASLPHQTQCLEMLDMGFVLFLHGFLCSSQMKFFCTCELSGLISFGGHKASSKTQVWCASISTGVVSTVFESL
jgi:hypothetical protein